MKKHIILGIVAGIVAKEVLFAILPRNSVYIDVLLGALIASLIGGRLIPGIVIAVYALAWKVTGLYFFTDYYGTHEVEKHLHLFLLDYLEALLIGVGGAWVGTLLNKYIGQRKRTASQ